MARTRRSARGRLAVAGLLALSVVLGAPAAFATTTAAPSPSATGGGEGTFTVGITQDIDSLNPFTGVVASAYEVWGTMYDTLTGYSEKDFAPTGRLAESWTTSPDGKTWTYTIRSGVSWSDGVPLTAKDVAYTFNRILENPYEQTNYGSYTGNITSVTAPDDTTVVMTTKVPTPIMTRLAVPILPEHVWSKVSEKDVKKYTNEKDVVGSGPFILTERKTGQFVRLRANPAYWEGAPKIDELVFRIYNNGDALAQALKSGEIDIADGLDADPFKALQSADGITAYPAEYYELNELAFNTGAALDDGTPIGDGNPALKDKKLRVALSWAVDRATLLDRVLNNNGTVGSTVIPPIYSALHAEPSDVIGFDLAKANQLLDEAGYAKGADGVRTAPGSTKPLVFRLFARQNSQTSQQSAKFIQGWFKEVGVTVTVKVVSEDSLTEIIGRGDFDMFLWGWVVEPDPDYQLSTFTCAKRSYKDGDAVLVNLSDSFYCNKDYDALYEKQAAQVDPAERAATVKQMQQMLYEDAPYVVLYYPDNLEAYRSQWSGFVAQPEGGALVFQYGTYSYRNVEKKKAATASAGATTGAGGSAEPSGGVSTTLVLAIGGGVVAALAAAGGLVAFSRRRTDMDRE